MWNSTLSGNHAFYGGGIYNFGNMTNKNSTISQNKADSGGGGIYNSQGTANVYNMTIVFNQADADSNGTGLAGGVFNDDAGPAVFNLRNTLLAGNLTDPQGFGGGAYDDCGGTLTTYGWNLIKAVLVSSSCTIGGHNSTWTDFNALSTLGPLQNNGGPTWTHALLQGSPAIDDAAPCTDENSIPLPTDQRGAARIVGSSCDIGAFEYRPPLYLPLLSR